MPSLACPRRWRPADRRLQLRGLTLIELLVVVAVIGLLTALLLPALNVTRETSRRTHCLANLRQIGLGLSGYAAVWGAFPPGCVEPKKKRIAWSVFLLPHVGEAELARRFDVNLRARSLENQSAGAVVIPLYLCPSTARLAQGRFGNRSGDLNRNGKLDAGEYLAMTDYGGIFGAVSTDPKKFMNGVLIWDRPVRQAEITDGLSQTLIVGEDTGRGPTMDGEWVNGENIFDQAGKINVWQDNELWSDHPGVANVLFCDGSTRMLAETIEEPILRALCTRNGDDVVPGEIYE